MILINPFYKFNIRNRIILSRLWDILQDKSYIKATSSFNLHTKLSFLVRNINVNVANSSELRHRNYSSQGSKQTKTSNKEHDNIQKNQNESDDENDDTNRKPPLLMNFKPIMYPSFIYTLKNLIFQTFIIRPYFDKEFDIRTFLEGAKQALFTVSSCLAEGQLNQLEGLVSPEALREIRSNFSQLNVKERHSLRINPEDIFFSFPYQVGIIMEDESNKRFVEILVVYHCMPGSMYLKREDLVEGFAKQRAIICNYRFIRNYSKGVEDSWTINRLNHFTSHHLNPRL